ncbi:MAG: DUF5053 domain-containing protein [Polaribacter sp.]
MAIAIKEESLKTKLSDILVDISWAKISRKYFGKSSSWIYDKLVGNEKGFTKEEKEEFKNALLDLSNRIKKCADKL